MNYNNVDYQSLMDLCTANEEAPGFDLGSWFSRHESCGTVGCLVGNYALSRLGTDEILCAGVVNSFSFLLVDYTFQDIAARFGLSDKESEWLFASCNFPRREGFGLVLDSITHGDSIGGRSQGDRHAAIARVRKLIYYKLRKRELLYEEDGRLRESARRTEGNLGLCAHGTRIAEMMAAG